jgi:hypothetical protein
MHCFPLLSTSNATLRPIALAMPPLNDPGTSAGMLMLDFD